MYHFVTCFVLPCTGNELKQNTTQDDSVVALRRWRMNEAVVALTVTSCFATACHDKLRRLHKVSDKNLQHSLDGLTPQPVPRLTPKTQKVASVVTPY